MKYIPNLLTLANLFFGCVAITFILNAPAFLTTVTGEDYHPVMALEQIYWGSVFIGLAALMDVLDGLSARVLKAESVIGKDLDSLADVVSFGVAPAMILFKFLWWSYMSEPGALETSMWVTAPAFLIPCFGALRLARYNQTADQQKQYFIGMPIPAVGLFVASLPLIQWFPSALDIKPVLLNRWILYTIIIVLSYLMVSNVRFMKWKPAASDFRAWFPQIFLSLILIIGFFFLKFGIVPVVFAFYILLSVFYPKTKINNKNEIYSAS